MKVNFLLAVESVTQRKGFKTQIVVDRTTTDRAPCLALNLLQCCDCKPSPGQQGFRNSVEEPRQRVTPIKTCDRRIQRAKEATSVAATSATAAT